MHLAAPERLLGCLLLAHQAGEEAGVLGRVAGEEVERGAGDPAQGDQPVTVRVEEVVRGARGSGRRGERGREPVPLLDQGAAGGDGVAQDLHQVGSRVAVHLGDVGQPREVLGEGGQVRIEAVQIVLHAREVVADPVAAPLEGGGERGERGVELAGLHGPQQRQQVVHQLLELDADAGAVLGDDIAGADGPGRGARGRDQVDVLLAEQRLGQQACVRVGRDGRDVLRLERDVERRLRPVGMHRAHLADQQPAQLDVGARIELVAEAVGLQLDPYGRGEHLLVHGDGQGQQQREHGEEHDAVQPQSQHSHPAHPAIRTVVPAPQIASDRKKSRTLIATIEVRTARPTATPTPAGPPLA